MGGGAGLVPWERGPPGASFQFYLREACIPKPDPHGKDIIQPESLGTYIL